MPKGVIGKKIGMTTVFGEDGTAVGGHHHRGDPEPRTRSPYR